MPTSVNVINTPFNNEVDVNADLGLFMQDTWTTKRLTISPGVALRSFQLVDPGADAKPPAASCRRVSSTRFPTSRTGTTSRRGSAPHTI